MLKTALALAALSPIAFFSAPAPTPQGPCPSMIRGDMDGDGQANIVDLVLFNDRLTSGDRRADMNYDGSFNIADWVVLFDVYETGGVITIANEKSPMDVNLDGNVNIADLVVQSAHVFQTGSSLGNVTRYHTTPPQGDSSTNIADFIVYINWWLAGCR